MLKRLPYAIWFQTNENEKQVEYELAILTCFRAREVLGLFSWFFLQTKDRPLLFLIVSLTTDNYHETWRLDGLLLLLLIECSPFSNDRFFTKMVAIMGGAAVFTKTLVSHASL